MSADYINKNLPMDALNEIPLLNSDSRCITALKKDGSSVAGHQLSDGQIIDKAEAVNLAKKGGIQGISVSNRNNTEYTK